MTCTQQQRPDQQHCTPDGFKAIHTHTLKPPPRPGTCAGNVLGVGRQAGGQARPHPYTTRGLTNLTSGIT